MSDCGGFGILAFFSALAIGTSMGADPLEGLVVLSIMYVAVVGLG